MDFSLATKCNRGVVGGNNDLLSSAEDTPKFVIDHRAAVDQESFQHLPKQLQYEVLKSPWAAWVERQIREKVEAEIRKELTDRFADLCAEKIRAEGEAIEAALLQEKSEQLAAIEESWRQELESTSHAFEDDITWPHSLLFFHHFFLLLVFVCTIVSFPFMLRHASPSPILSSLSPSLVISITHTALLPHLTFFLHIPFP